MDSNVSPALPTDLIHPAQGAKILGISGPTLWGWIRSGKLRAWRLDAARMGVSKADVEAILQPAVMPLRLQHDTTAERRGGEGGARSQ
jgi:hypothetical protein